MAASDFVSLFETRPIKGRILYRLFAASMLVAICFICLYRISCFPLEGEALQKWSWFGLFLAELWFIFYWFLSIPSRWYSVRRFPHTDRLSQRYGKELPGVDIFVCTADPFIEPPSMVVNTVLSVMAYDYPPEKLSVYLSDDGGSDITFYAMLEAASFSKIWLPFCNKLKVEPRSPEVYFKTGFESVKGIEAETENANEWLSVKKQYEAMKMRIDTVTELKRVPEELRKQHKGFREWDCVSSKLDHQTIIQIIIDGRDPKAMDIEGKPLPTLVYLAREKRPNYHHNFKAGAMNALIRVSSKISNGAVILNVDCDMYSNNSESVKQSLCFFMDEEKGNEIAFVQYPQGFDNITKNEIYGGTYRVITKIEFHGMDANGGPCYIGTGCFHRRESLCGRKYDKDFKVDWKRLSNEKIKDSASVLEETCKVLASCTFENDTQWGKEMGLKYGFPAEDVVTGLGIHWNGWKSMYLNPEREAFLGVSPTSLLQLLVQHKRWSEGHLQIFLSRCCPLLCTKIPLRLRLAICIYNLWAANSLPTLYYVTVPCLCLLKQVSLFPKMLNPWMLPFVYVAFAHHAYGLGEFLYSGGTFLGWCNDQRVCLFKRTTSYFFGFCDTILKMLGVSDVGFVVTAKVTDDDVSERYEKELIEFGATSPMFDIIATIAMLHLFSTLVAVKKAIFNDSNILDIFGLQFLLSLVLVAINLPVYNALFLRKDNGRMPSSVTCKSIAFALLAITISMY